MKRYDDWPFSVAFAVEMDEDLFMESPDVLELVAVTRGYLDAGMVGLALTYFIKAPGYEARNHMDGNYQMVLPLAAKQAGRRPPEPIITILSYCTNLTGR